MYDILILVKVCEHQRFRADAARHTCHITVTPSLRKKSLQGWRNGDSWSFVTKEADVSMTLCGGLWKPSTRLCVGVFHLLRSWPPALCPAGGQLPMACSNAPRGLSPHPLHKHLLVCCPWGNVCHRASLSQNELEEETSAPVWRRNEKQILNI